MYDAKFKTLKTALSFYEGQIEEGISAYYPQFDGDNWIVRTIET